MHIDYYYDENHTIFAHNDTYDILRIFNSEDKSWNRVTYTFMKLRHDHNLKQISEQEALKITGISAEESMLQTVRIIKSNMGEI